MRNRLASLRRAPLVLEGDKTNVNRVRINANMRVHNVVGNAYLAKCPRTRTCMTTNDATTLKLRGGVLVDNVRLRHLHRRVHINRRNDHVITRMCLSPARVPIALNNHVTREEDDRRLDGNNNMTRVGARANPLVIRTLLNNDDVITCRHARKAINRVNRTIAGTLCHANLIGGEKNRTGRTIDTMNRRVHLNNDNVLTSTIDANLPISDVLARRNRFAGLRGSPPVSTRNYAYIHRVRINTNMRVDHTIRNAANAKRPRLRTRVPTNDATTLELRRRISVNDIVIIIARLRNLNCRIHTNRRH